jgi:hypothetical protein
MLAEDGSPTRGDADMTRTTFTLGLLLAGSCAAGCGGFDTPRMLRGTPRPDQPGLSIEEQERRGRARYGIAEDDFRIGPKTFVDRPDPVSGGYGGGVGSR